MVQLGIYVCAEYMYMCVYMHVCVRQKITSNVFLRHHPPLCLCVGTHMCAQVCVPMCVGVCAGASVCMWRPEVNFWCLQLVFEKALDRVHLLCVKKQINRKIEIT